MKKAIGIVLGILMCIGGVYCLFAPVLTYSTVAIIMAITMIESSIGFFYIWNLGRKVGKPNTWMLVQAILSLVAGILLIANDSLKIVMDTMILGMVAGYMIIVGVISIINAFKVKKLTEGKDWIALLIMGILIVISGVLSLINPAALAISLGIMMAMNIITTGINLITISSTLKN